MVKKLSSNEPLVRLAAVVFLFALGYSFAGPRRSCPATNNNSDGQSLAASRWPLVVMKTTTDPPFLISLPTPQEDEFRFNIIYSGQYYETALTEKFAETIDSEGMNGHVVDVGCNAGWFTLYSAALLQHHRLRGQVYCFEANPNLHSRLKDSVRFNSGFQSIVTIVPKAVSDHQGQAQFTWMPGHYGGGKLGVEDESKEERWYKKQEEPAQKTKVQLTTLDSAMAALHVDTSKLPIVVLKIDVEGFECFVLKGASKLLRTRRVYNIFLEISKIQPEGCSIKEQLGALVKLGYELRRSYDRRAPTQSDAAKMVDDIVADTARSDYDDAWLYLPPSKRAAFEKAL